MRSSASFIVDTFEREQVEGLDKLPPLRCWSAALRANAPVPVDKAADSDYKSKVIDVFGKRCKAYYALRVKFAALDQGMDGAQTKTFAEYAAENTSNVKDLLKKVEKPPLLDGQKKSDQTWHAVALKQYDDAQATAR